MITLQRASPAGKAELALLQTMQVGSVRQDLLFPALDTYIEWECTKAEPRPLVGAFVSIWEFQGLFLKQPLCRVVITVTSEVLTLEMVS